MAKLFTLALLLIGLGGACGGGSGMRRDSDPRRAPGDVAFLGEREVDFRGERDTIAVGRAPGRFSAIRIDVGDQPIELWDIRVSFGDGTSFSPDTRLLFGEGEHSRRIDLPGGDRIIREVTFLYRSVRVGRDPTVARTNERATVRLYGLR